MKQFSLSIAASIVALAAASAVLAQSDPNATAAAPSGQDQQLTTKAQPAAPASISKDAAIAVAENGKLRTIRQGSNGWTSSLQFSCWRPGSSDNR